MFNVKEESNKSSEQNNNMFFDTYGLRILKSIRRIIRAVSIHSKKLNTEFNITAPQMICLYSLAGGDGMTLSDLSKDVALGLSTVNGIVDRLEAKGLVLRERSTMDRRKVHLQITDDGRDIVKSAPSLLQERFTDALIELPELEQAAIALSLERVVSLMEAEHLDASPNLIPNSKLDQENL